MPIQLQRHLNRFSKFYPGSSPEIPSALFGRDARQRVSPSGLPNLPLPSRKSEYSCKASTRDGVVWFGAKTGLTRYDPAAPCKNDRIMYFSATRDLPSNEVLALLPVEPEDESVFEALWVRTKGGVARITMKWLTAEEKANLLLRENLDVVDRRGMITQKMLTRPRDPTSKVSYNASDNDGCFGCAFAMAELLHYGTLRRELGPEHPETQRIKAVCARSSEAMLLLTYMPGRGDGFVARTYMAPYEPVPDDGFYFEKLGDGTARVLPTTPALNRGVAGMIIDAGAPVPERLARLYEGVAPGGVGLVYKGDTSSDEITLHFAHAYYLHLTLARDDPELAALSAQACRNMMGHILDHGCQMHDAFGGPALWAKWDEDYFSCGLGWIDACLNAAEILMYLRVTMEVAGETGRWQAAYEDLLAKGYAALGPKHAERFDQMARMENMDLPEAIMFGDHMLATAAFWPLILLEPDPALREIYRAGYKAWRGTIGRDHNPGYDIPFMLACPDEPIDMALLERWFYRSPASRLAAPVSLEARADMPVRMYLNDYKETGWRLPDDERFIAKYNRSPWLYTGRGSDCMIDSCYPYTFAYWLGRYYGVLA
ncbi:MAG: hypothetical protein FWE98_03005 [Oscillospiraceae bacterium]|nr:hypothetical protein [Oscillospiraceae bacterium]